jgi:hypothetical protein
MLVTSYIKVFSYNIGNIEMWNSFIIMLKFEIYALFYFCNYK